LEKDTPQVFSGISREHYARLVESARAAGVDLSGDNGIASKLGIQIAWNYIPEKRELVIHCLRAPFFLDIGEVNRKMHNLVEGARPERPAVVEG
jgi:hypothetical protein